MMYANHTSTCASECPDYPGLVCVVDHERSASSIHYAQGRTWSDVSLSGASLTEHERRARIARGDPDGVVVCTSPTHGPCRIDENGVHQPLAYTEGTVR